MRGSSSQRPRCCSVIPHTAGRNITYTTTSINRLMSALFSGHSRSSDLFSIRFVLIVLSVIYLSAHAFIPSVSMESNAFQNAMPDNGGEDTVARLSQIIKMCF